MSQKLTMTYRPSEFKMNDFRINQKSDKGPFLTGVKGHEVRKRETLKSLKDYKEPESPKARSGACSPLNSPLKSSFNKSGQFFVKNLGNRLGQRNSSMAELKSFCSEEFQETQRTKMLMERLSSPNEGYFGPIQVGLSSKLEMRSQRENEEIGHFNGEKPKKFLFLRQFIPKKAPVTQSCTKQPKRRSSLEPQGSNENPRLRALPEMNPSQPNPKASFKTEDQTQQRIPEPNQKMFKTFQQRSQEKEGEKRRGTVKLFNTRKSVNFLKDSPSSKRQIGTARSMSIVGLNGQPTLASLTMINNNSNNQNTKKNIQVQGGEPELYFQPKNEKELGYLGLTYLTKTEMNGILKALKEKNSHQASTNAVNAQEANVLPDLDKSNNGLDASCDGHSPKEHLKGDSALNIDQEVAAANHGAMHEFIRSMKTGFNSFNSDNRELQENRRHLVSQRIYKSLIILGKLLDTGNKKNKKKMMQRIMEFNSPLERAIFNSIYTDLHPQLSPKYISGFILGNLSPEGDMLNYAELFLSKLVGYAEETIHHACLSSTGKFKECFDKLFKTKESQLMTFGMKSLGMPIDFGYVERATKFEVNRKSIVDEMNLMFKKDPIKKTLIDPLSGNLYSQTKKNFQNWAEIAEKNPLNE